ncbi:uncharacterized protein LOC114448141 [Parambassis ranga]|uniref:Uncharacterized protein LOC114448141 n=1 Tax=Parambassis ranga TaxID=210632 RepID=A0A6P7JUT5_9TELE|nr:uncharacterized protein LOC114448141 [Parambassis ranga]
MAMNKNTSPPPKGSSKYEDIISKSKRIRDKGYPFIYHLTTETKKLGSITVKTLGEKNPNMTNKTVLLVGETGAGKSTLVNTLVNFSMGVRFEDEVWFEMVEKDDRKQSESQTSDVIVYQIFDFKEKVLPYSLTIIDTPGYGHTEGIEHDVIVSDSLLHLVRSEGGVDEVNAVGLVVKAAECRLSDRLSYILNSVVSLFGKDLEKKIVALVTYSNGREPKNVLQALEDAQIKCAKDEKNQPVYFLFDNCQDEPRTDDVEDLKHMVEKTTMKGLQPFEKFLNQTGPQKLTKTRHVLTERIRLTSCVRNLEERINTVEKRQGEIRQHQETLKKYEEEMKKNEKFEIEVDEVYKDKQPISGGMWLMFLYDAALCCTVCEENCHYPGCTVAWSPNQCEVIKDGRCTSCTKKCPASEHVKEKFIYVTKTRKVQKTLQEVKSIYDKFKTDSEKEASDLSGLQRKMEELEEEKSRLLHEAYEHIVELEKHALNINSVSTHVHLDFLIEKMQEKKDEEKVRKLKEFRKQTDKGVLAALKYMFTGRK